MLIRSLVVGALVTVATLGSGPAVLAEPGDPDPNFGDGLVEFFDYGVSGQLVTLNDGEWVLGHTRVEGASSTRDHVVVGFWNDQTGPSKFVVFDKLDVSIELVELLAHHDRVDVVMSDIRSDGSVRTLVARLFEDGTPDLTWNGGQPVSISNATRSVAATTAVSTADGGIVLVAGKRLVKLTSRGLIDVNFSGDGVAPLKLPTDDAIVTDIIRRKKGELVLSTIGRPDRQNYRTYITVVQADGRVKKQFGNKGTQRVSLKGYSSVLTLDIDTMPNGNLALGLAVADGQQSDPTYRSGVAVVSGRTGKLDRSFSEDGVAVLATTTTSGCCVAVQSDGRILLAGASGRWWRIARFAPNGSKDRSFGDQGTASIPLTATDGSSVSDLAIDAGAERLLVAGSERDDQSGEFYIALGALSLV